MGFGERPSSLTSKKRIVPACSFMVLSQPWGLVKGPLA